MRIAIDTGGTFTDCVYASRDGLQILKIPSTPADPAKALLQAIDTVAPNNASEVRHGTTVGTNALLERKGARVAFVTTGGFEDTMAIGRQARPKLYDLFWSKEPPLADENLRFGVAERVASDGTVLLPLIEAELRRLKAAILAARPEAVGVSLLFSFANPLHERLVASTLRELNLPISVSHEILPEFREYERGSTVLINAYLAPKMQRYLERIDSALCSRGSSFSVMQSSGGILEATLAAREPVRTILSGPAGGVVGATAVAQAAGYQRILTFDMGGTSTDVTLVNGNEGLQTTKESLIMGMPVAVPMLNIHTVGAGGGSIARFDPGGALRVGPESAGASPGPICYGSGELPTVTDANLLLGRLDAQRFLSGGLHLNEDRARKHFLKAKGPLASVEQFAEGIVRIVDAHLEKALRRISVEQGYDPRDFVLVSFGGAGPLHAVALARALRISRVLVPNFPGALSAYGILVSDTVRDHSRTIMVRADDSSIEEHFLELEKDREGVAIRSLDIRYAGQAYELAVPWSSGFIEQFHRLHEQRYGYADRKRPLEVVNARVRMITRTDAIPAKTIQPSDSQNPVLLRKPIYYGGAWMEGTVYNRECLRPGGRLSGPAVIVEYSATTFLPPDSAVLVDERNNLIVEVET
ncbi:MAG: hydantoinase/oxoprolinase family protein [Acidobacteriaceae bacterium]|nr:hydantoinase/oxoprolinase family protein [Acidobacteriaceae bacterium]